MQHLHEFRARAFFVLTVLFLLAATPVAAATVDWAGNPIATNGSNNQGWVLNQLGSGSTATYQIVNGLTGATVT